MASVIKSSDVIVSALGKASSHAPFILSSLAVCVFITVFAAFLPLGVSVGIIQSVSAIVGIFLAVYILTTRHYLDRRIDLICRNLHQLGSDEKDILRIYLTKDISCRSCSPILDPPVASLISKGVLKIASGVFYDRYAPVAIDPRVQKQLRKTPEVLGLSKEDIGKNTGDDETDPRIGGFFQ